MEERIKAGEDEQRHHGTQGHHVVELRFQEVTSVNSCQCVIAGLILTIRSICETAGEVL